MDQLTSRRLQQKYLLRLVTEAKELESAARFLDVPDRRAAALDSIRHVAHRIAGSAGVFGYSKLGDLGAELERMTIEDADGDVLFDMCNTLIEELSNITQPGARAVSPAELG